MQRRVKNIIVLGLLLVLAVPLIFSTSILVKQKVLQYQRRARFETEILQTIRVSVENLHWIKPGKEILINGKMFDVKAYHQEAGDFLLTGFYDHKEEKMVKHMNDLLHQKHKPAHPYSHATVKFLMFALYHEAAGFSIGDSWQIVSHRFLNYTELISSITYDAATPPPKDC
jgi:hypothetical protein